MREGPRLLVRFAARQFNHWNAELAAADKSIANGHEWLESEVLQLTTG
jgi:hypothetical protein